MLRNTWGGWGAITFVQLAHMVDATQDIGWGGVGFHVKRAVPKSLNNRGPDVFF